LNFDGAQKKKKNAKKKKKKMLKEQMSEPSSAIVQLLPTPLSPIKRILKKWSLQDTQARDEGESL
jgi:hypothetical protein